MRAVVVALALLTATAYADDEPAGNIIFARGGQLFRVDTRGRGETAIATLPAKATVRALRTDAAGKILLVDLGGKWLWMPLDGTAALAELPCADGPAQLAEDGACVLCSSASGSQIVNLGNGKTTPIEIPAPGARLAHAGADRVLVWTDGKSVFTAPPRAPKQSKVVAPEAPLRGFSPSPDASHAFGVYADEIYTDAHHKKPADVLEVFALDVQGARRKSVKSGVPFEWSHDSQWALVQDGSQACIVRASGGQYKCWRGFSPASIAPDGKYALLLFARDKKPPPPPPRKLPKDKHGRPILPKSPPPDQPTDEGEGDETEAPAEDVAIPPPSGPLSLYRAQLEGAFTTAPQLIVKAVDGAAVWVPAP
ncbi:MAG: hypothetical protein JO257_01835 [Deltaproteobacteria bacterium]|nr:hypothetical protein [Deltaproteobacteria bacterium]